MKRLSLAFIGVLVLTAQAWAREPLRVPADETLGHLEKLSLSADNPYAKIDVKESTEAVDILAGKDYAAKAGKAEQVLAHPEKYNPPVLYMLSYVLFQQGRKDEAMFWFYAAQVRGRYDANRCADLSARPAVQELNRKIGPYINPYAFQDLEKLKQTVVRALEWERTTPHLYDQRWINLHGTEATTSAMKSLSGAQIHEEPVMSLPESQWEEIHKKTLDEYMADFKEALGILKERAAEK
jgi:hypothetical protein